jgi:hypothetical protein
MEVIVKAKVEYSYRVHVPENEPFISYCDSADPAYERIAKVLTYEGLDFEGTILSIYDDENERIIYEG